MMGAPRPVVARIQRPSAGVGARIAIVAVIAAAVALSGGCERRRSGPKTIKIGTVLPESHPTAASLQVFKKRVEELSGGQLRADVFFNSQLGSADEVLELCRMGDVEMAQVSAANLAVYVRSSNVLAMPFIWRDSEHQARALDGAVGGIIRDHARPLGIEILGYCDAGTRNISTKTGPIRRPEDLRGLKIRVMNAPLMVATIDALGASAMALNQGEVYTALQMGVIDGWENNPMTIATFRMYETGCKYFAWTRHFSIPDVLVAGGPFLRELTEQQRQWVFQAARDTILAQRRMWKQSEQKALDQMVAGGMKLNEVDIEPFRARVTPIYEEYERRYGQEFTTLVDMIRNTP
jgi:TRAP-type transport system periplasmic protein